MALNLTQKLLQAHLAKPAELVPGNEIELTVDHTLTHDINAVMSYLAFEALDLDRIRTKLSVSYIDHNLLQIDNKTPDDHIYLQSIAQRYGLVLSKAGNGICHTLQYSRFGKPGAMLLGGDSHTPSCGALGMLAIGVGGMDIAVALAGFPYVLKMPKIVKVNLKGHLQPGSAAKDIILEMLRRCTVKGGVGKSVAACNLAAELAAKSKSVLVVDLDKQGNTSKFFGVLDYDSPSVAEVMLGEDDILAAIVKGVDVWGVHLLPCDMRMLKANRTILMDNGPRQFHLRDALKCVAGDYDYCIMDCPPDLDMGSINALCAADWVIIPVDCDRWACDGMQEIVEQIEQVQAYYNPRLKIMGALMTKYRRTRYAEDIIVQLCASGISVLETVIRYTVKVSEAAHAGMPLLEYCPDCTAAVDYRELTEEVERIVSNMDTKEG